MIFLLILTVLSVSAIYFAASASRTPKNFPPGPKPRLIVGYLPQLRALSKRLGGQHLALTQLSRKYNTNVLGLKLGNELVVCVSSLRTIKAVLTGAEYEGRPDNFFFRLRSMGTRKGITGTDGPLWKQQRCFVVTHLRALGYGKRPMELLIKDEVVEILSKLSNGDDDVDVDAILAPAILNVLWTLTTGSRFTDDSQLNELLALLKLRARAFDMSGGLIAYYPWLRHVIPERIGFNLLRKINTKLKEVITQTINDHKAKWSDGNYDDLIYAFLTEMKKNQADGTYFTDDQLVMVCLDMFIAGSQTTSGTLNFAFRMMILYPDVQRRVHECIDETWGASGEIYYGDKHRASYVEAVLLEVQRYCTVVPISGPRRVLRKTYLEGYTIPKNTTVLINLHSLHNDKSQWRHPEKFLPDRFLDEEGNLLSHEGLIPFGLGRRKCLGDSLAKTCIFIIFAEVLRRYSVEACAPSTGKTVFGLTAAPEKYKAKFTPRFK